MTKWILLVVLLLGALVHAESLLVADLLDVALKINHPVATTTRSETGEMRISQAEITRLAQSFRGPRHFNQILRTIPEAGGRRAAVRKALMPHFPCPNADPTLAKCPPPPVVDYSGVDLKGHDH